MDDMSNMDMSGMEHMDHMAMATPTPATLSSSDMQLISTISFVGLLVGLFLIVCLWRIFTKAGQAGWKSIIPLYNVYVLLKIVGRPGWWLLLFFIPVVNIVISLVVSIDLGKSFGKSTAYSVVLLWLLNLIGYCLLAFGNDQYIGPGGVLMATPTEVPPSAEPPAEPSAPEPQVQLT